MLFKILDLSVFFFKIYGTVEMRSSRSTKEFN